MTTLRKELRTKFEEILTAFSDRLSISEREPLAEMMADAALELAGIKSAAQRREEREKKGDLIDGMAFFAKEAEKQGKGDIQDHQDRAERELRRLQFNILGTRAPDRDRFIRFLQTEEKKHGRTIEAWVEWCFTDGFWPGKISSVNKVMELWLKAFEQPQALSFDEQLAKAGYK